jgi:2-keto-4-pentenoate hydratase/2-oxohepta-3-ene-1,7-dioic acid hydratase in catechol pathway
VRWVRTAGAIPRLAVLADDHVHHLEGTRSLLDLLRSGTLAEAGEQALAGPGVALDRVSLLAPFDDPPSVRDFMAFEQHVDGVSRMVGAGPRVPEVWYEQPLFYFSNPASIIGPYDDVPVPPGSTVLDVELEVAAVIGVAGSDLTIDEAQRAIAGYLILNDWSARDLQFAEMRGPLGPCKGKDSATTLGPWFVTAAELEPRRSGTSFDLQMSWWIGEELIGSDRLDNMAWSFAEMVAYASRGTRLRPGDVFGSGTCGGGCLAEMWGRYGRDAHAPLRPGDVVRVSVEGLGTTANRIVAGADVRQPLQRRSPQDPASWSSAQS